MHSFVGIVIERVSVFYGPVMKNNKYIHTYIIRLEFKFIFGLFSPCSETYFDYFPHNASAKREILLHFFYSLYKLFKNCIIRDKVPPQDNVSFQHPFNQSMILFVVAYSYFSIFYKVFNLNNFLFDNTISLSHFVVKTSLDFIKLNCVIVLICV